MRGYSSLGIEVCNYRAFGDAGVVLPLQHHGAIALVGPNNSGKTSLLRLPYDLRKLIAEIMQPDNLKNICRTGSGLNTTYVANVARHYRYEGNDRPIRIKMSVDPTDSSFSLTEQRHLQLTMDSKGNPSVRYSVAPEVHEATKRSYEIVDGQIIVDGSHVADSGAMITALQDIHDSIYIPANRHLIRSEGNEHYDMLVGDKFIGILQQWLGGGSKEQTAKCRNVINDIKSVLELEEFNVTTDAQRGNIRFSMNGELMDIDQVGSGLLQLIQVLFTVATRHPTYVFIDEPETSLHPRLQQAFLNAIRRYCEKGLIFATHSIGLARSVADQIYAVHSVAGNRTIEPFSTNSSLTELLGEMSHSVYREFGFRKVLLVEGTTEIGVIREFLRLFGADMDVLLLSLGGSNLINGSREGELREFSRLGESIAVLIDSEKNTQESELEVSRAEFKTLCDELGFGLHILERRSTENYFSERAVKAVFGDLGRGLAEYEKLSDNADISRLGWNKKRNWEIAREMTKDELLATDLGRFLEDVVAKD